MPLVAKGRQSRANFSMSLEMTIVLRFLLGHLTVRYSHDHGKIMEL